MRCSSLQVSVLAEERVIVDLRLLGRRRSLRAVPGCSPVQPIHAKSNTPDSPIDFLIQVTTRLKVPATMDQGGPANAPPWLRCASMLHKQEPPLCFSTRRNSCRPMLASGMLQLVQVITTVSMLLVASGMYSAEPSRRRTVSSSFVRCSEHARVVPATGRAQDPTLAACKNGD